MSLNIATPWHRNSYDTFLQERLPRLLAERLPLDSYRIEEIDARTVAVTIALQTGAGRFTKTCTLPQPDPNGLFLIDGRQALVAPIAADDDLETAEIACVGEQLEGYCAARLGEGRADLPWTETLLRAWLPLDTWVQEFLAATALPLDTTNWLSRHTHLRRLYLPDRRRVPAPGSRGRTCPIETPEGPNVGRVLVVAVGAEIRKGRLKVIDDRPEAGLGLNASMIPFLEHNELMRLLMGANMMRQWLTPPDPEPALVQTGAEPEAPEFPCGRNLLTAFISWGADTFEDALLVSESCAQRLDYPRPLEPGDKLSNRFGTKGVVSRIVPDDEMPHLPDGSAVEIVYHFTGLVSRRDFGQVREALAGRIARAEGRPLLAPPFHAPGEEELRARMARAGLRPDGLEPLRDGKEGAMLEHPSLVGYVYWGKLTHTSREKMQATTGVGMGPLEFSDTLSSRDLRLAAEGQYQGERQYAALKEAGAVETIREQFNTRAAGRPDAGSLALRLAAGPVPQAAAPSPRFAELQRRLAVAGIRADLTHEGLQFGWAPPEGETLALAQPIPHPYLRERVLTHVGVFPQLPESTALVEANVRLKRTIEEAAPESLFKQAQSDLIAAADALFNALITPDLLRFDGEVLFSGRAVVAPGRDLTLDQTTLPDEMAWTLFGPLAARELGGVAALAEVEARSLRAEQALDRVMARSWILLNRTPSVVQTNLLAFHPVRCPEPVIRLHPAVCNWLDADFDGDQIAVFLPVTEAGQREAGERLSVRGHLNHNPALFSGLMSLHEVVLALADRTLTAEGRAEVAALVGLAEPPAHFVTRRMLIDAMGELLRRDGVDGFLTALEGLVRRGLELAKRSGRSIGPFPNAGRPVPPAPSTSNPEAWSRYSEEVTEQILVGADYSDPALGGLLLAVNSEARGGHSHISWLIGVPGSFLDQEGRSLPVRHNLRDGMTPEEFFRVSASVLAVHASRMAEWEAASRPPASGLGVSGPYPMARALRSPYPGVVFARAAAAGEIDPLNEPNVRLFVGL